MAKVAGILITAMLLIPACGTVTGQPETVAQPGPASSGQGEAAASARPGLFRIFLVRHAEKSAGGFDPDLTGFGRARALFLAEWMAGNDIRAVWSSDYKRTRNTAEPLAGKLGLEIQNYDPGNQAPLVNQLLEAKLDAVVVGHSNTVPELAAMLCECEIAPMPDTDYERAFLVVREDGKAVVNELDLKEIWTARPTLQE